jgi:saccharopine dehydrogenase-like NADP-dependent oxidoreductase
MVMKTPKILVVGSSGTLAKIIIRQVISSFGIDSLVISDYQKGRLQTLQKELREKHGQEPQAKLIDIRSAESIRHGIEHVDYVIVPVPQRQPLIQKACIEKGIVCIDLSVSENFIDSVLSLQPQAFEKRALLLVAAGLFPGLSGIIAKSIHEKDPNAIVDIGLIQAKDGVAGTTGIADMLQLFNQKVEYVTLLEKSVKKGFSFSKGFQLDGRFGTKNLRLADFIERKYLQQRADIRANYWSAFDDEIFNRIIALLRAIGFLSLFENQKYRLKLAQFISNKKKEANEEVVGIVGQTSNENRHFFTLESDYAATASCAVAFVKILNSSVQKKHGVFFPFELFDLDEILQTINEIIVK